jgi:hypothetical protein
LRGGKRHGAMPAGDVRRHFVLDKSEAVFKARRCSIKTNLNWGSGQKALRPELSSPFEMEECQVTPAGKTKKEILNMKLQKLIHTLIPIVCFGCLETAQAVVPAPDGCYPGFTTAEGCKALQSLTTGAGNTAIGWYSLFLSTTGSYNTAVGAGALVLNTADNNTATGAAALLLNTTGSNNTASGVDALVFNDTGSANTANGAFTLFSNTAGNFNTAGGFFALHDNTTGAGNTGNGASALLHNTTGGLNTAIGGNALFDNIDGGENTATGANALSSNIGGNRNTAMGSGALSSSDTDDNTAIGFQVLHSNTGGTGNTAVGVNAASSNSTGINNTASGAGSLSSNTSGDGNTAIGSSSLQNNTTGDLNVALGFNAGNNVATASNVISIGSLGADVDDSCYIGNIWQQPGGSQAVYVNASGKLGAMVSSQRFKDEIKPMEQASEVIYRLKPVSFRYKAEIEPTRPLGFGLIAEDVEKITSDLVARDREGKAYSVRYDQVNAMLLNEFLKEHRKNEEQEATITRLQKQVETLAAGLQKVSAQLSAASPSLADLN